MSGGYGRTIRALQSRVRPVALPRAERERLAEARVALIARLAADCSMCGVFAGAPVGSVAIVHLLQVHRAEYDAL